jgi:hypothetical protein
MKNIFIPLFIFGGFMIGLSTCELAQNFRKTKPPESDSLIQSISSKQDSILTLFKRRQGGETDKIKKIKYGNCCF